MMKKFLKKIRLKLIMPLILWKWKNDCKVLPLEEKHWNLYKIIHIRSILSLRLPNLANPKDLNEKIFWLMLFDQNISYVSMCDKLTLKDFVASRVGEGYCPETLMKLDAFKYDKTLLEGLPERFVLKTNHDSGGVVIIDKNKMSVDEIEYNFRKLEKRLSAHYGFMNGEWVYSLIRPCLFIEEYVGSELEAIPADFKFHCSDGKVLWLQYIYDRGNHTKEIIVNPEGCEIDISFDHNMISSTGFVKPENWNELLGIASDLSRGFKYVRVDMYNSNNSIKIGEMTLYPLAAGYRGNGQKMLGRLIDFDVSTFKPPVFCERLN